MLMKIKTEHKANFELEKGLIEHKTFEAGWHLIFVHCFLISLTNLFNIC